MFLVLFGCCIEIGPLECNFLNCMFCARLVGWWQCLLTLQDLTLKKTPFFEGFSLPALVISVTFHLKNENLAE